jgi:DNA-binding LacI/PurR family transcriptional regulator
MDDMKSTIQAKVTLKTVAEYTGLTPGTISAVLNNSAGARRIPESTKDRVRAAARQLNYRPNQLARALRTGQVTGTTDRNDFAATCGAIVIMDAGHFTLAMNAIQQAGLRVPDDVSVVELDSFPAAAMNYGSFEAPVKPS